MVVIQAPRERHREHDDRGDDQTASEQTADEQNTLSSTIHRRIPISQPARLTMQPREPWAHVLTTSLVALVV